MSIIRKLSHYYKKISRDFFNPLIYTLPQESFDSPVLGRYYLDFNEVRLLAGGSQNFHFDATGIPILPTDIDVAERKMHYYPIAIGQYGLAIFHSYLDNPSTENRSRFLKIVDWFSANQLGNGTWVATIPEPKFGLAPGWISAMAQGRGLNILLRGYQMTNNSEYLIKAEKALDAFTTTIPNGGVLSDWNGVPFYEEYPSKTPPHVLNGMIFALLGVWDLLRIYPNHGLARRVWDTGISSIKQKLAEYDQGYWTSYDVLHQNPNCRGAKNICTQHYHWIHIRQLEVLSRITHDAIFADYAKKWESYALSFVNRLRATLGKSLRVLTR